MDELIEQLNAAIAEWDSYGRYGKAIAACRKAALALSEARKEADGDEIFVHGGDFADDTLRISFRWPEKKQFSVGHVYRLIPIRPMTKDEIKALRRSRSHPEGEGNE